MPKITIESDEPMVVITLEEYESLKEAIEILSNPSLVKDIERARKEFREGKTISLEDNKKELNIENNQSEEDNG